MTNFIVCVFKYSKCSCLFRLYYISYVRMGTQKKTHLPKVRCTESFRHKAYKLAHKKGMDYAGLVRYLIRREAEKE